jgi:Toastrack DUF4097
VVTGILLKCASSLLTLIFALSIFQIASAQTFTKTFTVSPDSSELEVINQTGSIRITSGGPTGKIIINAKQGDGDNKIGASQTAEGKVKVEVTGRGAIDFDISVPPAVNLDLLCYKCLIMVANTTGAVVARNTDGPIQITGLRSPRVEANSRKGSVNFIGEILPSGNYTLKSFSGRVDATLPASADFKLQASSYRGGMNLGGFPLKFEKQSDQLVEGASGSGKATVSLWTQEGTIHLHRKP